MTRLPLLVAVVAWIAGGDILSAALYWGFLNTPESNVTMLAASALLIVAVAATVAVTVSVAAFVLGEGGWSSGLFRRAVRSIPLFWLSCLPAALVWWLSRAVERWTTSHSGEINAWFIASLGWSNVSILFTLVTVVLAWIRWVVSPTLVLTLFLKLTRPQYQRPVRASYRRTLGLATAWFLLLIVLPWQLVSWRPRGVPPTWVDPAVAGVRLLVVGVAITVGIALMIRATARTSSSRGESPGLQ